jgi:hypothetical protein
LKKRSKKISRPGSWALTPATPMTQSNQSFFATFCSQKVVLPSPSRLKKVTF